MSEIRVSEAARLLGVSDDTVRRWIDAGRLPATRSETGRRTVAGADLAAGGITEAELAREES